MKLRTYLFLFLLFPAGFCFAEKFLFETFTTRQGLSSNEISCVFEDNEHYLWIGTHDGLNRFDGRRFEIFRNDPENPNSLSGNSISSIVQDKQGLFWIATKDGGLTRYNPKAPKDVQFKQFKNNPKDSSSIATSRLLCLYDWDENYLLIGAEVYPGIFLNKKTLAFSYWDMTIDKMLPATALAHPASTTNWIQYMTSNDLRYVYISLLTSGNLYRVEKASGVIVKLHQNSLDVLSINHFFVDSGNIWISAWMNGLFKQPDTVVTTDTKVAAIDDLLMCVANMDKDYMLAGTRASGMYEVNKHNGASVAYQKDILQPHSLPGNKVNCILVDSRGIVWVGTGMGLAKYDKRTWLFDEKEFAGPETDCTILHCYRFEDGSVAVNTSKGMFLSDSRQENFKRLVFSSRGVPIIPACILKQGDKYILGTEIGFFEWQRGTNNITEMDIKQGGFYGSGNYEVRQILADTIDSQPGLWLAVMGNGLAYFNTVTKEYYQYLANVQVAGTIGNNRVRKVIKDKKNNIWVASDGGLFEWKASNKPGENKFEAYLNEPGNPGSLPNNQVSDIWCDAQNRIWVTMNGSGLARIEYGRITQYLPQNPSSSRSFMNMFADNKDRLWILTKNGIEIFDLRQKGFFHIDVNDGLANTNLTGTFSNETNGWVTFAAGNRVYSFQPDSLNFKSPFPPVYLAGMSAVGKDYLSEAQHGVAHLNANERYVNFTVSALQFTSPQTIRFQYKLQGLDENWNNSADGEIKYTNLPWGNFKLWVRVTNPGGQYSPEAVLAEFIIATPFYASWWFICIIIIDIAVIIYALYRYRINQIIALQKVRNKIARDLHDDIGSTLGSISFFSEAAKQQMHQSNTDGAEKMLLKIGDTSREMIENMSDIVWSVNPQNDTAKHLVERMRVFADDLVASSEIDLHFNFEPGIENIKLTMEQRKNVFLIFKEAIYNSIKYSHGKNLYVEMKKVNGIQLSIRDDGKGFDVNNYKSKNGNGLQNMRQRSQEIGATINIHSSVTGTVTELHV